MKILYISQTAIDLNQFSIYSDLSNAILNAGHDLTLVCVNSKIKKTEIVRKKNLTHINVKVANQFGVNLIKKALIIMSLKCKIIKAIKKYLSDEKFDLVIYSTPPITFAGVVKFCKNKFHCKSYLMLKDIFPQNAVDLGMLKKTGLKGFIYRYFKKQEKKLYNISDKIGCMSQKNIEYLLEKNNYLYKDKIELFPNAAKILKLSKPQLKNEIKNLGLDTKKLTFLYGGNLGKPQGLEHFASCVKACEKIKEVQFLIIGKGSEQVKLFESLKNIKNCLTKNFLAPEIYNKICKQVDVGLILLDKKNTIPNFPSRILSYMMNAKPMFACVDRNNDVNNLIDDAKCGTWCFSDNVDEFVKKVKWIVKNKSKLKQLGLNGRRYFEKNFNVDDCVKKLENLVKGEN